MKKKLITTAFASLLGVSTFAAQPSFSYQYQIIANSNSASDLLVMYDVKQEFIVIYNELVLSVNDNYHLQTVQDNLPSFIDQELGYAKYENDKIILTIGDGRGNSIEGDLKRNICDTETVNYRFFFIEWFR